ncbi:hypothetical protein ACWDXT_35280 [Streptomyces sp. NPDC003236]
MRRPPHLAPGSPAAPARPGVRTRGCRTDLWGSERVRALGARFLPELASCDLYVEPEDIEEFLDECALLRPHAAALDAHCGYREGYVAERLANITAAARRAQDVSGGVLVW